MKRSVELTGKNSASTTCILEPLRPAGESGLPAAAGIPKRFRRLKFNEMVIHGDFVADQFRRLEPWKGPSGFRADAFVRPIYRAAKTGRS
jgi:hypothetical protein